MDSLTPPPVPPVSGGHVDPTRLYHLRTVEGDQYGPGTLAGIRQWAKEGRVPRDAWLIPTDGSEPRPVLTDGELAMIVNAPPTISHGPTPVAASRSDATSGLIPYKNGPALVGYYVGVASLIPMLGLLAGPVAAVLGVMGLRKRLKDPAVRGLAHAWTAIILGSLTFIGHILFIVLMSMSSRW